MPRTSKQLQAERNRRRAQGLCIECSKPAAPYTRCARHRRMHRKNDHDRYMKLPPRKCLDCPKKIPKGETKRRCLECAATREVKLHRARSYKWWYENERKGSVRG